MNLHFIAIGGSVMHNLALAMQQQGHRVSGSDDEIREPSRSRLAAAGLLPATMGWFPDRVGPDVDAVILGMHARKDNPELLRAQELGLQIYSFPEFVYEHSKNKQRIVISGSHGKTTITSMIMHVLRGLGHDFDYLVGAQVQGFAQTVRLSAAAPIIIIEGDEYANSALDLRPKFLIYQPHIVVLSGIAWDHINIFPTETDYTNSFRQLLQALPKAGTIIYNVEDEKVNELVVRCTQGDYHYRHPYETPAYSTRNQLTTLKLDGKRGQLQVYGRHNMSNLAAAYHLCKQFAVTPEEFLREIASFKGASWRLEQVYADDKLTVIRDFAHSPSKVRATLAAVAERYKNANIIACLELHTFSSLNKTYLHQYKGALKKYKHKIVFIDNHAIALKKLEPISDAEVYEAFQDKHIQVVRNREALVYAVQQAMKPSRRLPTPKLLRPKAHVVLLMSSGSMDGLHYTHLLPTTTA